MRVESVPTSPPLPVSLAAKITPPPVTGTSSAHSTAAAATTTSPTSGPRNASVAPTVAAAPTPVHPKNISTEPRGEAVPSTASKWEGTNPEPSPPGLTSTSGGAHLTPMPEAHSPGSPEASLPVTGTLAPTLSSSPAPSSLSSSLPTSLPDVPSPTVTSERGSSVTSILASGTPTTPESATEGHSSGPTPTSHATAEPVPKEKTTQYVEPDIMICDPETTTSFLIMQEVEHALSSGSIAAITVTVIAVVLLVFGMAAYLKIRHSSYGRLLDDHDYGSWGNYNNPLYDDS
uniref:Prostate androgen-regulated mucin-like protein 1 n=1 Tax=Jaculus jaculus TaxID=51337 RepID=A0A8C5L652_JACJA